MACDATSCHVDKVDFTCAINSAVLQLMCCYTCYHFSKTLETHGKWIESSMLSA